MRPVRKTERNFFVELIRPESDKTSSHCMHCAESAGQKENPPGGLPSRRAMRALPPFSRAAESHYPKQDQNTIRFAENEQPAGGSKPGGLFKESQPILAA